MNISGPLQNAQASTWQAVVGLLRNAFVKAILPGFVARPALFSNLASARPQK